mmetsp:Transcript_1168/g.2154  ORF Transcript_1168/g.2154 Transcript_1168/m.2154 type:complete len:96 (-) Transcript_1168:1125-1412(-)
MQGPHWEKTSYQHQAWNVIGRSTVQHSQKCAWQLQNHTFSKYAPSPHLTASMDGSMPVFSLYLLVSSLQKDSAKPSFTKLIVQPPKPPPIRREPK